MSADEEARVDVGIPAYGRPEFLVEAIESVFAQTLGAWRLTISENGPGSPEIQAMVQPYLDDPRVAYVATGGVSPAENWSRLIRTGRAPYVALLHDDDRWRPEFLERRVRFLDEQPDCGFAFSAPLDLDVHGQTAVRRQVDLRPGRQEREDFVPRLALENFVFPPTVLVRRSAYEAAGPFFDARCRTAMDQDMWLRIALRSPVGYLDGRDCEWRMHSGSLTQTLPRIGEERLEFIDYALAMVQRDLPAAMPSAAALARRRSFWEIKAGLDALEADRPRRALRLLALAVRNRPRAVLDPRVLVGGLGIVLGSRGRDRLSRLRGRRVRDGLRRGFGRTAPDAPRS